MKTKYRFINFVQKSELQWSVWNNRSNDFLGEVIFYKPFKKWELSLEQNVGFTKECLLDVVDFIKQLESQKHV
jgi:hypothetical protein